MYAMTSTETLSGHVQVNKQILNIREICKITPLEFKGI